MAERQGFEPWVGYYPHNRLAGGCLQPTRPPLPKENILPVRLFFVKKWAPDHNPSPEEKTFEMELFLLPALVVLDRLS